MKDKLKLTKTKLTFLILLLVIIALGTTYAILTWASSNTSIAGNTKCFKVDYTKGQDINFGSITSGTGLVAQTSFNKDEAVSTTLTISRNKDCDICGTGSISANITASIDLSKGGLSYKVYLGSSEVKSGSITKTGVNTLYDNFDIKYTTTNTYTIYFYLDANKIDNNYLKTNFTGKIYAEAKSTKEICKIDTLPTLLSTVTDKYNNGTKTPVTTAGGEAITQIVSEGLMQDSFGNIRYYGANPNNYVTFNGEAAGWRIIGVFDTEDEKGNVSKRIKLIRATSIGDYSWDNKDTTTGAKSDYGKNDWTTARLMKLLNPSTVYTTDSNDNGNGQSLYWNKTSGTCFDGQNNATTSCDFTSTGLTDTAKSQIDKVKYYLGGNSTSAVYADDYYNFERGTKVYSGHQPTWPGYIGLMYPSDYAYATDLSVCRKAGNNYDADNTNCRGKDWLLDTSNSTWTISPNSGSSYIAFGVYASGNVNNDYVYDSLGVRPVVYLKSSTQIVNGTGTGTQSDPYIIG